MSKQKTSGELRHELEVLETRAAELRQTQNELRAELQNSRQARALAMAGGADAPQVKPAGVLTDELETATQALQLLEKQQREMRETIAQVEVDEARSEQTKLLNEWGAAIDEVDELILEFYRKELAPRQQRISELQDAARRAERKVNEGRAGTISQLEYPQRYAKKSEGRPLPLLTALQYMSEGKALSASWRAGSSLPADYFQKRDENAPEWFKRADRSKVSNGLV